MDCLITVKNSKEAEILSDKDIDIVDIKNPDEGSLGCPTTNTVEEVLEALPESLGTSIALGDFPNIPGTASMAVKGALEYNTDYVKIGFKDSEEEAEIIAMLKACTEESKKSESNTKLVAAVYADKFQSKDVSLEKFVSLVAENGFDGVMIDTLEKKNGNLLDHMDTDRLSSFIDEAKKNDLVTGLAGSLSIDELEKVRSTGTDYIGVRGALCEDGRSVIDEKKTDLLLDKL